MNVRQLYLEYQKAGGCCEIISIKGKLFLDSRCFIKDKMIYHLSFLFKTNILHLAYKDIIE
jgi:hypothetical protein